MMSLRRAVPALALALATLLLASESEAVNPAKCATPQRYDRSYLTIGTAFVDAPEPAITVGGFYQITLAKSQVVCDATCGGRGCITFPHVYAHAQANVGGSTSQRSYAVLGNLGLVYKLDRTPLFDSTIISAVGIVAQGALPERAVGPALRVEIFNNLAVQLGWIYLVSEDHGGVFGSVDFHWRLWDDLLGGRAAEDQP